MRRITAALVVVACLTCVSSGFAYSVASDDTDPKQVTGVELSEAEVSVPEKGMKKLIAKVLPTTAANKRVFWYSNDASVATVSENGIVTAVSRGVCSIGVVTEEGEFVDECVVNVTRNDDPHEERVTGVLLDTDELTMVVGQEYRIYADVAPVSALNKNVVWTVSDKKVLAVKDGFVRAVGVGDAVVTVTTEDGGYSASCYATVEEDFFSSGGGCSVAFGGSFAATLLLALPLVFLKK